MTQVLIILITFSEPGVAGEYGHKAAAAVAGVAGAAGITGAAAAGVAASKKEEWKPKNYGDHGEYMNDLGK